MKILKFSDELDWMEARKTKITGSRLGDIVVKRGTGQKIGFYELIAERLALPPTGENPMDRGHRLEQEAIDEFTKETGKEVDSSLVILVREDNESIAISPDGIIGEKEAVEIKCLSSARHIEAFLKNELPKEYREQMLQYFVVNDKLEKLYFCFYDPRIAVKQFFYFTFERKDIVEEIECAFQYQINILKEVNSIVNKLTF